MDTPDPLTLQIDALLPQTQCGKCGYQGCLPYAQALSRRQAGVNRCPPGGEQGMLALAALLNVPPLPLDPACGAERPRQVAVINEADCIGCAKCLPPCPVDAIVGAAKHMHTVVAELCTGCELCIDPCPVACIVMVPAPQPVWQRADADRARDRYRARNARLDRLAAEQAERRRRQLAALGLAPAGGG